VVELNGEKENVAFLKLGSGLGSNGGSLLQGSGDKQGIRLFYCSLDFKNKQVSISFSHIQLSFVMSKPVFHYEQRRLENGLVALEPFDPTKHVTQFVKVIKDTRAELFKYISFPVIETEADFIRELYDNISMSPGDCIYAIFDKTSEHGEENSNYAGVISLTATNPANAVTEMGVLIFPAFQRTHISTNAIGLLLLWILDPPSAGGLGLRRVEWQTHAENQASRKVALRMGFELEGILRWQRVSTPGVGLPVEVLEKRNGTTGEPPGRHTAIFSIVWDEWDEKRPKVLALMDRKR
jgi:RimJ/RimL family protein N-acetyltransferase